MKSSSFKLIYSVTNNLINNKIRSKLWLARLTMDWYLLTQETLKYRSTDWVTIHKTEHFTEQIILTKLVTNGPVMAI